MTHKPGDTVYLRCLVEETPSGGLWLRPCTSLGFVIAPSIVKRRRVVPPSLCSPLAPYSIHPIPGPAYVLTQQQAAEELLRSFNRENEASKENS